MKRRLFHLHIKATNDHKYYGSLVGLLLDNEKLGISKSYLEKYDWSQPYENDLIIIRKGFMSSANDIRNVSTK
jgi:hypothetical protein